MKPYLPLILLGLLAATACKTTQENYQKAYEAAVAQREDNQRIGIDSTIYGRIRNQARMSILTVGTDSLPLRTETIGYTDGGGASRETLRRYNVVVGQFKQVFNARQMRERLIAGGYDGAVIVHTREPLYYVVAGSVQSGPEAAALMQRVKDDKSLVLRAPLPFILRPSHLAR